jgi:alkylation response protein AidB-like acyl-CoA dehydrogenase
MVDFALTSRQQELIDRARTVAEARIAPRAAAYDEAGAFPTEIFADLREAGFLRSTIPERKGGLGLGVDNGDPLTHWMITRMIARGDASVGQSSQVHNNMCQLISVAGTEEQQRRFLDPVVNGGAILAGWGAEAPREGMPARRRTTTVKRVKGGYLIDGIKDYSTNAGVAKYVVLFVQVTEEDGSGGPIVLPVIDTETAAIEIDPTWWEGAIGMRATVSHRVRLHEVFVPDEDVIGDAGYYTRERFQAKLHPQFASNFLGQADAVLSFATDYVNNHGKSGDPYVQHHIAQMAIGVKEAEVLLYHTAWSWQQGGIEEGRLIGNYYRHSAERAVLDGIDHAVRACGSSALMKPHALERYERDMRFYTRHENGDAILATVGRAVLGLEYNPAAMRF